MISTVTVLWFLQLSGIAMPYGLKSPHVCVDMQDRMDSCLATILRQLLKATKASVLLYLVDTEELIMSGGHAGNGLLPSFGRKGQPHRLRKWDTYKRRGK